MATVTKRTVKGKEYYQLNWHQGGKPFRKSLGPVTRITPHDAKIACDAKSLELRTGRKLFTASPSFEDHRAEYLTWHAAEYPDSHFRVKQILEQHCGDFEGKQVAAITTPEIEKWKAKRRSQVAAETVAKELRSLKACLRRAVDWGGCEKNAAKGVSPPQNNNSKVERYYDKGDLARLYAMPLHGQHWRFFATAGTRRGETMQLRNGDVKLKLREIWVESTDAERTKSGEYRIIPMNDEAIAAATAIQKAARLAFHEAHGRLPTAAEFDALPFLPPMAKESWSRAFRIDRDRLGLRKIKGSLVHALRHCYGTHSVNDGVHIVSVQKLMGHADLKTTMRYVNPSTKELHKQARKLRA